MSNNNFRTFNETEIKSGKIYFKKIYRKFWIILKIEEFLGKL